MSAMNRDGLVSPSSTAVTINCTRARDTATSNARVSSSSTAARAERKSALPVARSAAPTGPSATASAKPLRPQDRVAQGEARPGALLEPCDDDHVPFAPLGRCRRREGHHIRRGGARAQVVGGKILALEIVEERLGACLGKPLGERLSGPQQADDGVQIGIVSRGSAERGIPPGIGDAEGLPCGPHHLPAVALPARHLGACRRNGGASASRGGGFGARE